MANLYDFLDASRAAEAFDMQSDLAARMKEAMATASGEVSEGGMVAQMLGSCRSYTLN